MSKSNVLQLLLYRYCRNKSHNQPGQCLSSSTIFRRVMVILNIDVLVPGDQVGKVLGSVNADNAKAEEATSNAAQQANAAPRPVMNQQVAPKAASRASWIHFVAFLLHVEHTLF